MPARKNVARVSACFSLLCPETKPLPKHLDFGLSDLSSVAESLLSTEEWAPLEEGVENAADAGVIQTGKGFQRTEDFEKTVLNSGHGDGVRVSRL